MKKLMTLRWAFMALGASHVSALGADVFEGKDGLVVMEAESTKSSKGKWKKLTSVKEFTGDSHFEFTGNKPASGPAKNPLKYSFTVDKDGDYKLLIRAFKRLDGEPKDRCNDCYVKLKGDFESGGDAPLKMLKEDTKLYGGHHEKWGWTSKLDEGHKKFNPVYKLKAGETYLLTVSGRSQRFNMDRIVFRHSSVSDKKAMDVKLEESGKN
ncbi:MAG: hypothetical protein ACSHX6_05360 [Akkermansiaceae bacterium]